MIEVTLIGNWALVVIAGEFDISNAGEIRTVAADLSSHRVTEVTVDLSRVTFIDAAAISALLAADQLISDADGRMLLVGASPLTQRVFDLAGVERSLPLVRLPLPVPERDGADQDAPVGDDDLARLLYEVSQRLLTEATVTGDLQSVVRAAVDLVPGCTAASIALIARSRSRSAAVSDQVAVQVELAQYSTDQGPCLAAVSTSDRIRVDVLSADERFALFAPLALQLGICAVLSVPVSVGEVIIGTLNLYSATGWGAGADAMGDIVASQIAAALTKSEIYSAALALARRVQQRSDGERDINIAAGVLAGFEQCSIDQAERLLRSSARQAGEPLATAAKRVIDYLGGAPAVGR